MLDKVNITVVIKDHLNTLRNDADNSVYKPDLILFFLIPVALGLLIAGFYGQLNSSNIGIVTASLSIFAALLFNLLLLVFDAASKPGQTRSRLLRGLFANISFAILVALFAIILSLTLMLIREYTAQRILSFALYYLVSVFLLTLIMILKRVHILIREEFGTT